MRNLRLEALGTRRLLSGWGGAGASAATVLRPEDTAAVAEALSSVRAAGGNALARGLGRSYGDAAQCAGGVVIDCTCLDGSDSLDDETGLLTAGAGASLDGVLRQALPRGWFLPVSPGTRHVSLGGALAADIHGKNHHVDGSLSAHVESISLMTAAGEVLSGSRLGHDEFAATCGGMGLTGIVTSITLRLIPVETSYIEVDTVRAGDLDSCLALLSTENGRYRYSVAWVDGLATGGKLGRAVLSRGNHAARADLGGRRRARPLEYDPHEIVSVPFTPPWSLVTPLTAALFNEMWYLKAPAQQDTRLQTVASFFHPLDGVGGWNALYGRRGFTQYQFVVPFGQEKVLTGVLELLQRRRAAPFLAVLKRFGTEGSGMISFPMAGWTLAMDMPLGADGLGVLLDEVDEMVATAGGRVYLAKDGRLRPELLAAMYPRLAQWRSVRDRLDPAGLFRSDLGRRLHLCGELSGVAS